MAPAPPPVMTGQQWALLFARFPDVFLALGRPSLEDEFELDPKCGARATVTETAASLIVQLELPRRSMVNKAPARDQESLSPFSRSRRLVAERSTSRPQPLGVPGLSLAMEAPECLRPAFFIGAGESNEKESDSEPEQQQARRRSCPGDVDCAKVDPELGADSARALQPTWRGQSPARPAARALLAKVQAQTRKAEEVEASPPLKELAGFGDGKALPQHVPEGIQDRIFFRALAEMSPVCSKDELGIPIQHSQSDKVHPSAAAGRRARQCLDDPGKPMLAKPGSHDPWGKTGVKHKACNWSMDLLEN